MHRTGVLMLQHHLKRSTPRHALRAALLGGGVVVEETPPSGPFCIRFPWLHSCLVCRRSWVQVKKAWQQGLGKTLLCLRPRESLPVRGGRTDPLELVAGGLRGPWAGPEDGRGRLWGSTRLCLVLSKCCQGSSPFRRTAKPCSRRCHACGTPAWAFVDRLPGFWAVASIVKGWRAQIQYLPRAEVKGTSGTPGGPAGSGRVAGGCPSLPLERPLGRFSLPFSLSHATGGLSWAGHFPSWPDAFLPLPPAEASHDV